MEQLRKLGIHCQYPLYEKLTKEFQIKSQKVKSHIYERNPSIEKTLKQKIINKRTKTVTPRKRRTYQNYPFELKVHAIQLANKHGFERASEITKIPQCNIKKWQKIGPERKKGSGRKVKDIEMEENLYEVLYKERENLNKLKRKQKEQHIKNKAKQLTNFPQSFKASKCWLDKFCQRFNINIDDLSTLHGNHANNMKKIKEKTQMVKDGIKIFMNNLSNFSSNYQSKTDEKKSFMKTLSNFSCNYLSKTNEDKKINFKEENLKLIQKQHTTSKTSKQNVQRNSFKSKSIKDKKVFQKVKIEEWKSIIKEQQFKNQIKRKIRTQKRLSKRSKRIKKSTNKNLISKKKLKSKQSNKQPKFKINSYTSKNNRYSEIFQLNQPNPGTTSSSLNIQLDISSQIPTSSSFLDNLISEEIVPHIPKQEEPKEESNQLSDNFKTSGIKEESNLLNQLNQIGKTSSILLEIIHKSGGQEILRNYQKVYKQHGIQRKYRHLSNVQVLKGLEAKYKWQNRGEEYNTDFIKALETNINFKILQKKAKKNGIKANQSKINLIKELIRKGVTFQKDTSPQLSKILNQITLDEKKLNNKREYNAWQQCFKVLNDF